jgi:hypothetical protein
MKKMILSLVLITASIANADGPECTQEPREKWLKSDQMKSKAEMMGYKIKKFMTLEKCFEITGELNGKKVVHYFNPVDGSLVSVPVAAPAKK